MAGVKLCRRSVKLCKHPSGLFQGPLDPKMSHQLLLTVGHGMQRVAGLRCLFHLAGQGLADPSNVTDAMADVLDHSALLQGSAGDLLVHVLDHFHGVADVLQCRLGLST